MSRVHTRRFGLFLLLSLPCFSDSSKISPDLITREPSSLADVIVQFAGLPDAADGARIRALGRTPKTDLGGIDAAVCTMSGPDLMDQSTNVANVSRIAYSQIFVPGITSTADQYGSHRLAIG
jgi:hypothetical protein